MVSALAAKDNPEIARIRAEGKVTVKVTSLLAVLEARGLGLSETSRRRILATTDLPTLERWIRRAAVVDSADAIFAETKTGS